MTKRAESPVAVQSGDGVPLLEIENVHVRFGGNVALVDESFHVMPGEIVGLLGHNGAGKSTLVNVATGALRPQRGIMRIEGAPIPLRGDPRETERAGLKVIHQEPALSDVLTVEQNITLGRREESLSLKARRQFAANALTLLGSSMNVDQLVSGLQFGEKQIVDLARALSTNLRVLFLDEPTGALGQHETDRLHALLRKLAAERRGIVYVSHRLRDILEVCTRLVVLRGGRVVLDRPALGFGIAELSEALAPGLKGKDGALTKRENMPLILKVDRGKGAPLQFKRGEIVGLFGMAAGPQFRFLEALFGIKDNLEAELDGRRYVPHSPREAIRRGVFYVSANRERDGLLKDMSALDNLVLPWINAHRRLLVFSHSKAARVYRRAEKALNVRGGHMDAPVGALSGGNRQKIVVGRWLFGETPKILLLSQPTQGVDVGARQDIARALQRLTADGVTVLVASSESDEIELLCDRAIICEGDDWFPSQPGLDWSERLLEGLISHSSHSA